MTYWLVFTTGVLVWLLVLELHARIKRGTWMSGLWGRWKREHPGASWVIVGVYLAITIFVIIHLQFQWP
jgi:hypothetical protein